MRTGPVSQIVRPADSNVENMEVATTRVASLCVSANLPTKVTIARHVLPHTKTTIPMEAVNLPARPLLSHAVMAVPVTTVREPHCANVPTVSQVNFVTAA